MKKMFRSLFFHCEKSIFAFSSDYSPFSSWFILVHSRKSVIILHILHYRYAYPFFGCIGTSIRLWTIFARFKSDIFVYLLYMNQ
jgi:hypothetical protein